MIILKEQSSLDLWLGIGKARHFQCSIDSSFQDILKKSMAEAAQVRRERRTSKTRKSLLESLRRAGINASSQTGLKDREDDIGLIGEIIVEHASTARKYEILWPKWKVGGTSKSPGIDVVAKAPRSTGSELRLVESKHLHDEIKGKTHEACSSAIKARFKDGIEEFDQNKTTLNIAGVAVQMGATIRKGRAAGLNVASLERSRDFVSSKLAQDEYAAEVVACVDSKYSTNTSLSMSVLQLQLPSSVGRHSMNLALLACDFLEGVTDQI